MPLSDSYRKPYIYITTYIMICVSNVAFLNSFESLKGIFYSIVYIILNGIGILFSYSYINEDERPNSYLLFLLFPFPFLAFFYSFFYGTKEASFGIFLLWIQIVRNFSLYTAKDFKFTYLITLFILLYSSAFNELTTYVLYLAIYTLSAIFTQVYDQCYGKNWTNKNILTYISPLISYTLLLSGITIGLYIIAPKITFASIKGLIDKKDYIEKMNYGSSQNNIEKESKIKEEKRKEEEDQFELFGNHLNDITRKPPTKEDDLLLFTIKTSNPSYLIGEYFDQFDGKNWKRSHFTKNKIKSEKLKAKSYDTIFILTDLPSTLYLKKNTKFIEFLNGKDLLKEEDGVVRVTTSLKKGDIYSFISEESSKVEKIIFPYEIYKYVPSEMKSYLKEEADKLVNPSLTDYEKALILEKYFKEGEFKYVREVFPPSEEDLIKSFLFETKEGNCMYFSTAMALILRVLEIPSRYVTGYQVKNYNEDIGMYEVYRSNSHAWVEAFIKEYGWVSFDPTPSYDFKNYSDLQDKNKLDMIDLIFMKFLKIKFSLKNSLTDYSLIYISIIVIIPFVLFLKRINNKKTSQIELKSNEDEIYLYYRLTCELLAKKGYPKKESETPVEYLENIPTSLNNIIPPFNLITCLFMEARYGKHPIKKEEAKAVKKSYDEICSIL